MSVFEDGGSMRAEASVILRAAASEWESMGSDSAIDSLLACYEYRSASEAAQREAVLMLARGLESQRNGGPDIARQAEAWEYAARSADGGEDAG